MAVSCIIITKNNYYESSHDAFSEKEKTHFLNN